MHVLDTVRPSVNMPTSTPRTMRTGVQFSVAMVAQKVVYAHRDVGGVLRTWFASHIRAILTLCYANDMSTAANQTMSLPRVYVHSVMLRHVLCDLYCSERCRCLCRMTCRVIGTSEVC